MNEVLEEIKDIDNELSKLSEIEDRNLREKTRQDLELKKMQLLNILTFGKQVEHAGEKQLVALLGDLSKAVNFKDSIKHVNMKYIDLKIGIITKEIKKRSSKLLLTTK